MPRVYVGAGDVTIGPAGWLIVALLVWAIRGRCRR